MIGARLKAFREYRGLSQTEFAKAAGIKSSHMSAIEREDSSPTSIVLEKLIESNHIDGRWVFGQLERVEDADLLRAPAVKTEDVAKRLAAIEGKLAETSAVAESFDPIAYSVRVKPALKELVTLVKDYEPAVIQEVRALAYGFLAGRGIGRIYERESEAELDNMGLHNRPSARIVIFPHRRSSKG